MDRNQVPNLPLKDIPGVYLKALCIYFNDESIKTGEPIKSIDMNKTMLDHISKDEWEGIVLHKADQFIFLETLRETGITNMFGAGPYLAKGMHLEAREANKVLSEWMKNYDPKDYKEADRTAAID